jgi:CubicO group peptidase (beta-lactamase class C family)
MMTFLRRATVALWVCATSVAAQTAAPPAKNLDDVLSWNQPQRESSFRAMETLFPTHTVAHGAHPYPLPKGAPIAAFQPGGANAAALDDYIASQKVSGIILLQDGKIRLERYGLGYSAAGRWTSFSVAKSITSTLVGAAVKDGYIKSLDESVTKYIADLRGSAYEGVTIRQLLTMTSGVRWNEDYADPKSDIARLYLDKPDSGVDANVSYVRKLPREAEPGTKWAYKTVETNLIGVLVMEATHKTLSEYLAEKIWRPYGMERDAAWSIDAIGHEQGGCCLSVGLHDFARVGQFLLDSAKIGGTSIVPDGWIAAATHKQADIGSPGAGYGYQWWTTDDGTFDAYGIYGQNIHIDPARRVVIVINSAWPVATGRAYSSARREFERLILSALDAETTSKR